LELASSADQTSKEPGFWRSAATSRETTQEGSGAGASDTFGELEKGAETALSALKPSATTTTPRSMGRQGAPSTRQLPHRARELHVVGSSAKH